MNCAGSVHGGGPTTGFIFQKLGPAVTYQAGSYVLTTTINTTSNLTVAALVNSGVGLGFLDNATTSSRGTEVLSSQTTSSAPAVRSPTKTILSKKRKSPDRFATSPA
jgi:hypothetical protein